MEPFKGAPVSRIARAGSTCAEIVDVAYATGALDRAWDDALTLYVGDQEVLRALWPNVRPKAGALVALRPRPRWPYIWAAIEVIWGYAVEYGIVEAVAYAAVAYGISALTATDPDTLSFEPRFSIQSARNETRPYATWPAVLGAHRVFPPHAARPWTRTDGEKVWLHALLGLGLGPVEIDPDSIKIGDTPLSNFAGASWSVKEAPGDPVPDPWQYVSVDEDEGPGLINEVDDWITRTTDSTEVDAIEVELAWLEGLVRITAGQKRDGITIQLRIRYREVGETDWREFGTGAASGAGAVAAEGTLIEITGKTELPFRKVYRRSLLGGGQFEVGVKRVEPDYDNPNIRTKFGWSKLRTNTNAPPILDPNLSLLSVTVEAGPQVNNVIDQVNCVITRVAPQWDAEEEEWGAAGPTSNPAELVRWIATGPGMATPYLPEEIDEAFGPWAEMCTARDLRCDVDVRTGSSASPDELMQLVARCGRATIGRRGGKLIPVLDVDQAAASQLFTPRNSWGLRATRRLPPKTQAYRVEFNNAEKHYALDEMVVCFPGFTEETLDLAPELITVPGKTRAVEVYRDVKRRIAEVLLRGMDYTFNTDWEHFATARGKRIAYAHWDIAVSRRSGRVVELVLNEAETRVLSIVLDEEIEQTLGEDYAISWRRVDAADENPAPGMGVEALAITTVPGVSYELELAAEDGIPIADAPKVGDLVTFGDADIQVLDLVVGNVRRSPNYEAEIGAAAYVEELYADDDAPEPEWSSNISGDAFPPPPPPEIFGASATGNAIFVGFDFAAGTAHRVRGAEAFMRRADDTDARFALVASLNSEVRLAQCPPGERGKFYEIKIVSIGDGGRRTESDPVSVQSIGFAAPMTGELTQAAAVVATAADGSGGDYSGAGGTFRVRLGSVDITIDEDVAYAVESATGGLSISIDEETGVYTVTGLTENEGRAVLRATKDGVSIDLTYSIAKAREGVPGAPGDPPSGFVDTIIVPAGGSANLRALANANGYTGDSDTEILFILESGDVVRGGAGAPNGGIAIDTGEWPGGYTHDLTLQNDGDAEGGGGRGGNAESSGGQGGVALHCRVPITLTGSGAYRGGGGGGGGGGPAFDFVNEITALGGGGGGGRPNGGGGTKGTGSGGTLSSASTDGGTATPSANGATGSGEERTGPGGNVNGAPGGAGGTYATAGQTPSPGSGPGGSLPGGSGGAAGAAILKNGHTVTVGGGLTIVGSVVS